MQPRSDLEMKSRLILGIGLLSLVVVLLLRLLLPLLAIVGLGAVGYWLWQLRRKRQQQQARLNARLNAQFYQLLQQQQGRISVLDFAMCTQLDGAAAQAYLNTQAQAFSAFFETTPQGDIVYVFFSPAASGPTHQAHPEAVWAYSAQAKVEQAHIEKAHAAYAAHTAATHTAWSNAQQIRTLHSKQTAAAKGTAKSAISVDLKAPSSPKRTQSDRAPESASKPVIKLPKESGYPDPKPTAKKAALAPVNQALQDNASQPLVNQSPIIRGRAYSADDRIVTIDVTAIGS
ncbi:MAG: hypothetical protein WBA76_01470 [Phormidesmis sp.]